MNTFKVPPWMTTLCAVVLLGALMHVPLGMSGQHQKCPVLTSVEPTAAMACQPTANGTVSVQEVQTLGVNCQNTATVDFGHTQFSLAYPAVLSATTSDGNNLANYVDFGHTQFSTAHNDGTGATWATNNPYIYTARSDAKNGQGAFQYKCYAEKSDSHVIVVPEVATIANESDATAATNLPATEERSGNLAQRSGTHRLTATRIATAHLPAAFSIENGYGGAQSGNHQNTTDVNIYVT